MKNKKSARGAKFAEYTNYITDLFLAKYGQGLIIKSEIRNSWRYKFLYSPEAESFLILMTRTFIRSLNNADSNSTNPQFLDSLTTDIADYLSGYTVRGLPSTGYNSRTARRNAAKAIIKSAIFTDFPYIQNLFKEQAKKRALKQGPKSVRQRAQKQTEKQARKQAQTTYNEVISIFIELQTGPYRKQR